AIAALEHDHIVAIHQVGEDRGVPFLAMPLLKGESLQDRLDRDGKLPTVDVLRIGREIANGLAAAHEHGLIHRDVKPANILLAHGVRTAKLTDFGIARLVDSTRMTMHGMTVGTPNYLSPEQVTGAEVGPPADVYALGLVLLECATGQLVYPGHGVEAAVVRLHRPPAFPAWLDPEFTRLLVAMTQPDPAQRPSAAQAADELARLAARLPQALATAAPGASTQVLPIAVAAGSTELLPAGSARRPHWWRWLAAALVAAALVVVVVLATQHKRATPSTVRPPAYPSVPGQLGIHLHELQKQVQP
ncbi:MAG TPA: serine/threonine-protein kinase, partial [Frankiaceae bacterium]|nr:serine/threonine-protein kinase [Frankiaceae bacterium]